MEKKSFKYWLIFTLLAIWQLPQFLVALVMLPFIGKKHYICDRHYNIAFQADGALMQGSISLGPFIYMSEYRMKHLNYAPYLAHELDGHTVDSKKFGPLYLFIIGIPSLLSCTFNWTKCQFDFYTEKRANKYAKLKVTQYCTLEFEDKKLES